MAGGEEAAALASLKRDLQRILKVRAAYVVPLTDEAVLSMIAAFRAYDGNDADATT
jgi:acetyl esterase/lipase